MYYSSFGFLAALILLIIHKDILFRKSTAEEVPADKAYRRFLFAVLAYYITDILWGVLEDAHSVILLYIDTTVYFLVMVLAVLFWTQYVAAYLEDKDVYERMLGFVGKIFCGASIVIVIVNIFIPVLFRFDEDAVYHAEPGRYILLGIQIALFAITSFSMMRTMSRTEGAVRRRHRTIGIYALAMALLIIMQLLYPLLPLYSIGYMLGTCLIHSFVFEDEKEEYHRELEESMIREKMNEEARDAALKQAYRDPLTGARSKLAHIETTAMRDREIAGNRAGEFAVAVFDVNDLKGINDSKGHKFGDEYIIGAFRMIAGCFIHSAVFRIGGDEFTAILEGPDYEHRYSLMEKFHKLSEESGRMGEVTVSAGMSEYIPGTDLNSHQVFERADRDMYRRKRELKK